MLTPYFITVFLIFVHCVTAEYSLDDFESAVAKNAETGQLEFCDFVNQYNYTCYKYEVITEDGYILTIFRVPGDPKKPVLCLHGFLDSSFTWVLRGYNSLVAFLANNSYDIWLGNIRGNMLSRAHVTLNPDCAEFWNFSITEMAIYDLPAMCDRVLEETGQTQLQVIGHSQATQLFFVLGSLKPKYCSKIKNVVCFAPIAYINYANLVPLAGGPLLSAGIGYLGYGEILRNSSELVRLYRTACSLGLVGYTTCGVAVSSVFFGSDPEQFESAFFPIALKYSPCGSSLKNFVHLAQIATSQELKHYDYGVENLFRYGSLRPPKYNLSKVPFNVSIYVGENDPLSTIDNANRLWAELREEVKQEYYVMPYKKWNHIDFIWGKYMINYLFNRLLETLKKYY